MTVDQEIPSMNQEEEVLNSVDQFLDKFSCQNVAKMNRDQILEKRKQFLGPNMAIFFHEDPLHILKGQGCYLFDSQGDSYLDCINNVSHVGHCHPRVAAAAARQLFTLNTNSRYLHENLVNFAERLSNTTGSDDLHIVFPVCSGSEANDLAWRIASSAARAYLSRTTDQISTTDDDGSDAMMTRFDSSVSLTSTISTATSSSTSSTPTHNTTTNTASVGTDRSTPLHVAVMDHAYHGHTNFCIDISPYKFSGPGGGGRPTYVHVLPCPDPFRGLHMDGTVSARAAIAAAKSMGGHIAAFYSESIISCGGQVILPPGYLTDVYQEMRAEGALCIADEVQCGFGRVGSCFWAYQLQNVIPDIVTCGKPMGNGFPMAAVITTSDIADTFANGMEFFATYGGSTAAATVGLAVLDVIKDEGLQENAIEIGGFVLQQLKKLQSQYPEIVGDVRGHGLMIGIELVTDSSSRDPSPAAARFIKERCKSMHRVLLSCEGPFVNVIKIKPPMCFSKPDCDRMVFALKESLEELSKENQGEIVRKSREEFEAIKVRRELLLR